MKSTISTFFVIARGILSGKTITRSLMNDSLREITISGQVLDLGSKAGKSSYYEYIKQSPSTQITFTDLYPAEGVAVCDVTKRFPFPDNQFDFALAFNLMEHVYEYKNIFPETFRVLRNGGTFIGHVPFIYRYHPDPEDYFRFSHTALMKLLTDYGFSNIRVHPNFTGPLTLGLDIALSSLLPGRLSLLRVVIIPPCLLCDRLLGKFRRVNKNENYAHGHTFIARKGVV